MVLFFLWYKFTINFVYNYSYHNIFQIVTEGKTVVQITDQHNHPPKLSNSKNISEENIRLMESVKKWKETYVSDEEEN